MKEKLTIYYDAEGDFLELNVGGIAEGRFKNLGKGIFERIDKKTNKVTGIAIHGFLKRTAQNKDVKITLPVKLELVS